MSKVADLKDKVYGLLTVVSFDGVLRTASGRTRAMWGCMCECGNSCVVQNGQLTSGRTKSCGCLKRRKKTEYYASPTYKSWHMMKQRCNNSNYDRYDYYGGRGISYQESWEDFKVFLDEMGVRPDNTTLDRIDVNGNYTKDNCRWATTSEQAYNKNMQENNISGKTGVQKDVRNDSWIATIQYKSKQIHLGSFPTFELAVSAREQGEIKYYGTLKGN